jgi:hypothetical protein
MPYILTKTNGNTLTTVQDATLDNTTNLIFLGRNYAGYGQPIEENFIKLLENFSNKTAPSRPIQGQLWFDSNDTVQRLKVCYDGTNFRDANNVLVRDTAPANPKTGDVWWNTITSQMNVYINGVWTVSSPYGGASTSWNFDRVQDSLGNNQNAIKGLSRSNVMIVISNTTGTYTPSISANVPASIFPLIKPGITLPYANSSTGKSAVSSSTGYMLWGTAAHSLSSTAVELSTTGDNSRYYIPFASTATGIQQLVTTSSFYFNPYTNVLNVTATQAQYADLAERYEADAEYDVGTVVVIGGEKEVTVTDLRANTAVAGIVSKNPAYMMNSAAGTDETHPFIALKGRVPCQVVGRVDKGDLLVTSVYPGYAASWVHGDSPNAVIGKALGNQSEGFGTIEVLVV